MLAPIAPIPSDDAALHAEIKRVIVQAIERDEVTPESIGDDDILVGEGSALALDSLDALQAAVAVSKRFGIRIQDGKHARRVMRTVTTLAAFIREKR